MARETTVNSLRVAVVGGSIGGLTTALLLRSLGCDVDVFERVTGDLTASGAGIVAHEVTLRYLLERTSTSLTSMTVGVDTFRLFDGAGSLLWEEPVAYKLVSWGSLYRSLLGEFGRREQGRQQSRQQYPTSTCVERDHCPSILPSLQLGSDIRRRRRG